MLQILPEDNQVTWWFVTISKGFSMLEHSVRFSQLEAMVDLHCLATWKTYVITKRGKKIRLSESQLLRSVRFFELRWKRSEKWIRGFFGKMKEKWWLDYSTSKDGTLVTLRREAQKEGGMKTEIMEEMDSVCHKRETVGSDQTWEELESGKVSNTSKELNSSKNYSYTIDYREAFEEINRIPVMDILNRFGYQTFRTGNKGVLGIYENGKKTRGHIVNVRDNYVRDFTEKRRFCGQPVALIKRLYKASTWAEIIGVASREFGFRIDDFRSSGPSAHAVTVQALPLLAEARPTKNPEQAKKWDALEPAMPTSSQTEYAAERQLSPDALGGILRFAGEDRLALAIKNSSSNEVMGIQTRAAGSVDKGYRYRIVVWGTQHGYFHDFPSGIGAVGAVQRKVLVVEWFTDYLSVRQFTPYVIGVASASSSCEDFGEFNRLGCTFAMVPHSDTAGESLFEKLSREVPIERIRFGSGNDDEWGGTVSDLNDYLVTHGRSKFWEFLHRAWVLLE